MFRAWEIKKFNIPINSPSTEIIPKIHFRRIEKIMLYLIRHIVQWAVLVLVKYWFITLAKIKKLINKKLPKLHNFFQKKTIEGEKKKSFLSRTLSDLKMKIKHTKERVIKENEEDVVK